VVRVKIKTASGRFGGEWTEARFKSEAKVVVGHQPYHRKGVDDDLMQIFVGDERLCKKPADKDINLFRYHYLRPAIYFCSDECKENYTSVHGIIDWSLEELVGRLKFLRDPEVIKLRRKINPEEARILNMLEKVAEEKPTDANRVEKSSLREKDVCELQLNPADNSFKYWKEVKVTATTTTHITVEWRDLSLTSWKKSLKIPIGSPNLRGLRKKKDTDENVFSLADECLRHWCKHYPTDQPETHEGGAGFGIGDIETVQSEIYTLEETVSTGSASKRDSIFSGHDNAFEEKADTTGLDVVPGLPSQSLTIENGFDYQYEDTSIRTSPAASVVGGSDGQLIPSLNSYSGSNSSGTGGHCSAAATISIGIPSVSGLTSGSSGISTRSSGGEEPSLRPQDELTRRRRLSRRASDSPVMLNLLEQILDQQK